MVGVGPWWKNQHPFTTGRDISSDAFWSQGFEKRDETFAWLRENAPVSWHAPREVQGLPPEVHGEAGFWAITKNADISYVSQNQDLFSADQKRWGGKDFRPANPAVLTKPTFLGMDPPEHTRYRQIMSAAFTPKAVARLSAKINERAEEIVSRVVGAGDFDFVSEVSARLPMLTVADLVGVPDSLVETFAHAGDALVGATDTEVLPDGMSPLEYVSKQLAILREIGVDLVNYRRKHPADDIATALANAEFDGQKLDDDDIQSVTMLLSVAGNDTTKQTTSQTVISLWRNPEQRVWLEEDFEGRIVGSIEEFIRHASPVIEFARTATQDVELRGQQISMGDKVAVFYCSGNRDEEVFADPHKFDLSRGRTAHVAFGGGGVHYCLGNGVAKAQLRAIFSRVLTKLPHMQVGDAEYLNSDFINGVKHLPVHA